MIFKLKAHSVYSGLQDGLAIICPELKYVYKTIDGINVVVKKNCSIQVLSDGPFRWIVQELLGGEIDRPPDKSWHGLFEKLSDS